MSVLSPLTGHLQQFEAQFTLSQSSLLIKLQESFLKLHHQSLLEFSLIPTDLTHFGWNQTLGEVGITISGNDINK